MWRGGAASSFAATGSAQNWKADDGCWACTLPFAFPFYGETYSVVYVNSNGTLAFDGSFSGYSESLAALKQHPMIAVMWDDLTTSAGDVFVDREADSVTIRWKGLAYSGGGAVEFSATLDRNGGIRLSYGAGNSAGGLVGISAGDGARWHVSSASQSGSMANHADICFSGASELPEGLVLTEEGLLTGKPTRTGVYAFGVGLVDRIGSVAVREFVMEVNPGVRATEQVGDYVWSYVVSNGVAVLMGGADGTAGGRCPAVTPSPTGRLDIPAELGGHPVVGIGERALASCASVTVQGIPSGVASISEQALGDCRNLMVVFVDRGDGERVRGLLSSAGCDVSSLTFCEAGVQHLVAFDLGEHGTRSGGGELLQAVSNRCAAVAPTVKAGRGWLFDGWNADFSCVTNDMTVGALYSVDPFTPKPDGAYTEQVGDYTWSYVISGGVATVVSETGYSYAVSPDPVGEIVIPSKLGQAPVVSVGSYAFWGCSGLTSVAIPSSVTSIGDGAFGGV